MGDTIFLGNPPIYEHINVVVKYKQGMRQNLQITCMRIRWKYVAGRIVHFRCNEIISMRYTHIHVLRLRFGKSNLVMGRKLTKFNTGWWFGTSFIFHILSIIIPTDELIFFRGVGIPPTRIVQHLPTQGLPWPCSQDSER